MRFVIFKNIFLKIVQDGNPNFECIRKWLYKFKKMKKVKFLNWAFTGILFCSSLAVLACNTGNGADNQCRYE